MLANTFAKTSTRLTTVGYFYNGAASSHFLCRSLPQPQVENVRTFKGSKRNTRIRARKEKIRLEHELKTKYGIDSRPVFRFDEWVKAHYQKEINALQHRLGFMFTNEGLLRSALIHPSFLEEMALSEGIAEEDIDKVMQDKIAIRDAAKSTELTAEKLALIGFNTALAHIKSSIYKRYPNMTPSICTDICNYLVGRETINQLAKNFGITDLIVLSDELERSEDINEETHLNFTKEDIDSDIFFAVMGAACVEFGQNKVEQFLDDVLITLIDYEDLSAHVHFESAESELVKILKMNNIDAPPVPRVIVRDGFSSHYPFFAIGIYCDCYQIGEGSGYSIKRAKEDAFRNAIFHILENDVDLEHVAVINTSE